MDSIDAITSLVEVRIDEIEAEFNTDIRPEIAALLTDIEELRDSIPTNMQECIRGHLDE